MRSSRVRTVILSIGDSITMPIVILKKENEEDLLHENSSDKVGYFK